ncbi:MAG TPA: glycine cleavage system aminomethyltransferase GcvT [Anaerolineaceae bacterium]|nr:glycine cleavage system aminomethyltransferase GcvT [Anaerolineaceae bacterium]HPN50178.1 glycine cleavage system aminomethyltransferase GcvT [Anaerolineaceae bacterium]
MTDFLFRGKLSDLDPDVYELTQLEAERQVRKLIMIPSESTAPAAVREALGSVFQNIYAEGYPDEETRWMTEEEILDYPARLGQYRRFGDPRYYKGVEYADVVESLARRRCAEAFAANGITADTLYANVQPLSGAPANNAVYTALLTPGDTILGMNLLHGGHLSHGSSVNRSGKWFKAVHYAVDPVTEQINYESVEALAKEHKPKIIIAGYSSYPYVPDWARFRAIADSVGAYLLADVSHIAGLIAAGVIPSPVGYAHIITFTTHKTLCGPRSAVVLTHDLTLARKLDKGVFPGEQGGPHVHAFAALALTFKLAQTPQFKALQAQIIKNCAALNARLKERGLRIPFGGSDTHLTNVDCKTVVGPDGTALSGDIAARILDVAGLVVNRNTIPGDKTALFASGVRLGTPWVTQRGLKEADMVEIADVIADLFQCAVPYTVETRKGPSARAKVDFKVLQNCRARLRALADKAGTDLETSKHGYPHFYYADDKPAPCYELTGDGIRQFVAYAFASDTEALQPGMSQATEMHTTEGIIEGTLTCVDQYTYRVSFKPEKASLGATWLRDLSDGYIALGGDPLRRLPGPIVVAEKNYALPEAPAMPAPAKPYFIGISPKENGAPLPEFKWTEVEQPLRRTSLYDTHRELGAKMVPFAGWEMPVWYSSVVEEHLACRQVAGLFDVSHMGVYQAEGPDAAAFLDSICGNDIITLEIGESCYTHFLDPDGRVIDDTLVYRRAAEKYLVVVNASNDDKDGAWFNAVKNGTVLIDRDHPAAKAYGRGLTLRNLRDPKEGADMRVDIALQGPKSRDILLSLGCDAATRRRIMGLTRTQLCEAVVGGFELVVSRTGYTGEKMAFELFIHPDQAPAFWKALMEKGTPLGMKPCGLGARDSLRTEAGLPLYGHEMGGGEGDLGVAEAGFGSYVKTYKPWFIGRSAFLAREAKRSGVVVRFRFTEKGVRMAHNGDPVLDKKGRVIGYVTSCAIDAEGFLTGQAYLELASAVEGTPIAIFQGAPKASGKAPAELKGGDRVTLPTPATVISRFPKL